MPIREKQGREIPKSSIKNVKGVFGTIGGAMFGSLGSKLKTGFQDKRTSIGDKATGIWNSSKAKAKAYNHTYNTNGASAAMSSMAYDAKKVGGNMASGLRGTGAFPGMALGAAYGAGSDDTSIVGGAMMGGIGGYAGLKGAGMAKSYMQSRNAGPALGLPAPR